MSQTIGSLVAAITSSPDHPEPELWQYQITNHPKNYEHQLFSLLIDKYTQGILIDEIIPFKISDAFFSKTNFISGKYNRFAGNTGPVTLTPFSNPISAPAYQTEGNAYGTLRITPTRKSISLRDAAKDLSLISPKNGAQGKALYGLTHTNAIGTISLSKEVINHLRTVYPKEKRVIPLRVLKIVSIDIGVSQKTLKTGAKKLYGGNVVLLLNNEELYTLGF